MAESGGRTAAGTPQLPLALRYPPEQRFAHYIGAPAGAIEQLRALACGAVERESAVQGTQAMHTQACAPDWVYLAGAAGTGKTHLALALCAEAEQAGRRAAYLPLAAGAGRLRQALEALDGHQVIALDGVEAVAGTRDDEVALFDFHNRARQAGLALLYTASAIPDALPLVLPDLRSRLSQCTRVVLQTLDDDGRRALLRDRAQRRGLVLEDAAIDWLLTRMGRETGQLAALLDQLDRASLAAHRRVTVPFLKQVLQ